MVRNFRERIRMKRVGRTAIRDSSRLVQRLVCAEGRRPHTIIESAHPDRFCRPRHRSRGGRLNFTDLHFVFERLTPYERRSPGDPGPTRSPRWVHGRRRLTSAPDRAALLRAPPASGAPCSGSHAAPASGNAVPRVSLTRPRISFRHPPPSPSTPSAIGSALLAFAAHFSAKAGSQPPLHRTPKASPRPG
jgi:hypothetical protein